MSAASGARSRRAIEATASAIDVGGRSFPSTSVRREAATEFIRFSEKSLVEGAIAATAFSPALRADLEIHRPGEGVGHRRPLLDVGHQRVDLGFRNPLAFHA